MNKGFWKILCNNYNYRFFSGLPFLGSETLYSTMDPSIMHYVPAANGHIALMMASGAFVSGFKSGVILPSEKLNRDSLKFNLDMCLPILIITSSNYDINTNLYSSGNLYDVLNYIDDKAASAVLVLGEDSI